jgi:glycosyltransferase involved in cell wall biosynthesis
MAIAPRASIIIPTYNRAAYLSVCLEALAALKTDPKTYEIIVVDNNSPDNTQDIVQEFANSNPTMCIRYMRETKQGASHARNRGVMEAHGEFVCFLDDDSPPSPEWLNVLMEGFVDPSVGCVGGPSILDYQEQERPPWLHGDLQGLLSGYGLPFSEPTQVSAWDQLPLSCNMAFRRILFTEMGLFRADLDRLGGQVLAAGDTEMADRVCKAGWKVMYLPDAVVRHIVAPERLRKSHIYRIGRGLATSHIILTSDSRPHMIARWFASDLWYATRMFFRLVIAIFQRRSLWFDDYMRFWMVAQRIPIRTKALLHGYTAKYLHSMR